MCWYTSRRPSGDHCGSGVRAPSRRHRADVVAKRAAVERDNPDVTLPGVGSFVGVEGDLLAVRRPCGSPCLIRSLRELNRVAAARAHHVQVVPAIAVAQERYPLAVGRGLRSAAGTARHAPELRLDVFGQELRLAAVGRSKKDAAALVVGALPVDQKPRAIHPARPAPAAEPAATATSGVLLHLAIGDRQHVSIGGWTGDPLGDGVDDLRAGILGRLFVPFRLAAAARPGQGEVAVVDPAHRRDRIRDRRNHLVPPVRERSDPNRAAIAEIGDPGAIARNAGAAKGDAGHRPHSSPIEGQRHQHALLKELNRLAVRAPEEPLRDAVRRQRPGPGAAVRGHDVQVRDAGAVPRERDPRTIPRPLRIGRMLDVDQLIDRDAGTGRPLSVGSGRHHGQRQRRHRHGKSSHR